MNPPIAPMKPPNGLGRGAMGAGDTGLGVAGRGAPGSGRAGAEYEREPRLPVLLLPAPARAQADPTSRTTNDVTIASVSTTSIRLCISASSSTAPSLGSSGRALDTRPPAGHPPWLRLSTG